MSGSISFNHGPFKGWHVALLTTWADGTLAHATVQLETPDYKLSGMLGFTPGIDGWEQAWAAEMHGGPTAMASLLEWVIEATAAALDRRTDITTGDRRHWQAIVDHADHSRADFFATYPDGQVPRFEVVAELAADRRTGELVAA